jgi:hypothetical protein
MALASRTASVARSGAGIVLVGALCVAPLLAGQLVGDASQRARLAPVADHATSFTPRTGATFNDPTGTKAQQYRILDVVNRTIDAVPRGGNIRIAVFSFTQKKTADALLRARARGVGVRIIFDDHKIYAQEARLRRALGSNPNAKSMVLYCHHACRGTAGDMHDKIFLFNRAGRARYVSMVGSNNMTWFNAERQWADVYTVANNPGVFSTYARLFSRLRAGQAEPQAARPSTYYQVRNGRYLSQFMPDPGAGGANDPVIRELAPVTCSGATGGTGWNGHTLVRVSMHAWYGGRGRVIATRLAALRANGCHVQVIPGITMGSQIRSTLRKAGVPLATIRHPARRTHQKVLQISGHYGSDTSARLVFTGSHNWSDRGLQCDDNILRIDSPTAYQRYAADFATIWRRG